VAESEITALYTAASVTAFVSLYEGFGLPALESMACGTPVVASNCSSLPEICGNAALLVDPTDTHQIASVIRQVLHDVELRERMISVGFERAAEFTWSRCALETLAFLRAIRDNSL
jgi:glycosyltransferase involved in cell wall biosynthesis